MSSENEKNLSFVLSKGDKIICERIVTDLPISTNANLRDVLPIVTRDIVSVLSAKEYDTRVKSGGKVIYDLEKYHKKMINLYPKKIRDILLENEALILTEHNIPRGDGTIVEYKDVVECKFGVYICGSPIVERMLYINRFNPLCNQTLEVVEVFNTCVELMKKQIKMGEMNAMWYAYDKELEKYTEVAQ